MELLAGGTATLEILGVMTFLARGKWLERWTIRANLDRPAFDAAALGKNFPRG